MTTPNHNKLSKLQRRLSELNQYKIDLGLDRLTVVLKRLELDQLSQQVITVGGTNGKGSTVSALCSLLKTQEKSFGAFTSPHIFSFNERININGQLATDEEILNAFRVIDDAKDKINLSYFEYAFLAALLIFRSHEVDVFIHEVGLGGRLDATNAVDSDGVIITTVDIDHTEWLGTDIESIAQEKAGIMRSQNPVIYGDINTPNSIISFAEGCDAQLQQFSRDYHIDYDQVYFTYTYKGCVFKQLTRPQLQGDWQLRNLAAALTLLIDLGYSFDQSRVQEAIDHWHIKGRLETVNEKPLVLADVAHNQQAISQLVKYLKDHPIEGQTRAVFSVLADKQTEFWLGPLNEVIDHWLIFQLPNERATALNDLKLTLADQVSVFSQFGSGKEAYDMALSLSHDGDRVIVFGSFHVLDEVFKHQQSSKE